MSKRRLRLTDTDNAEIEAALTELRRELDVTVGFAPEVVAEAERSALEQTAVEVGPPLELGTPRLRRHLTRHARRRRDDC